MSYNDLAAGDVVVHVDHPEVRGTIRRIEKDGRVRVFEIDWAGTLPKEASDYITVGRLRRVQRGSVLKAVTREPGDDEAYAAFLETMCEGIAPEEPGPDDYQGAVPWTFHWSLYMAFHTGWKARKSAEETRGEDSHA